MGGENFLIQLPKYFMSIFIDILGSLWEFYNESVKWVLFPLICLATASNLGIVSF